MGAAWVSMELGTKGPLGSQCTACAASNMAIGDGMDMIRLGRAEVMLCGGTEAPVTEVGIAGFGAMRALSRRNDDAERASRPFDAEPRRLRDGRGRGRSSCWRSSSTRRRAARRSTRSWSATASPPTRRTSPTPTPPGESPARAMKMAFDDAGIDPSEIGYINAHGTSTPVGDASETRVIKLAVGEERAYEIPVSSTKGATGHCLGAARRGGGDLLDARRRSAASCRRRSTTRRPTPSATSTTSRTRRARRTSRSPSPTRSASAGTTRRSSSASSTTSAARASDRAARG